MTSGSAEANARIPVTLVTGFLGSGKTTLINAALKAPELADTVVVVNEFGEVGLDHSLYSRSNDAVIVLENGCLCCTVRSDLVATLNSLFHARQAGEIPRFRHMIIETSGLAEPGPVLQAFLSEPTLDGLYRVARVVTLVDAVNWRDTAREHDEAVRQVAFADEIRITKLDMAPDGADARLSADLRRINSAAAIAPVERTTAAIAALLSTDGFDPADPSADPRRWLALSHYEAHDAHGHHHACGPECDDPDHHHDHDDHHHHNADHFAARGIESFVLKRENPLSRDELQFLLDGIGQNLGTGLLRVKGLVNVAEEPGRPAVIQGAQHLLHTMTWLDQWPDDDHRTRIVFITQGIARQSLSEVIELLDRMAARTFKARERARQARADQAAS
ncbi:CobW family GTP-binding protein [Segnochrobactrum spirostomi]|uniref:GTP-binding protein n=1 Tax=Segnochrobactrum spirostomi TaxID=2608987 RepID=A0A6A7Y680_9HYPH|nr:GTP-binding protein [Segnochrobactrum spirostomi]MQT14790.1 GTP-binding protein [Segnochrobactrum spirostomi]